MTLLSIEHISRSVETGFIRKQKKEIFHDISFCVGKRETVGHYRGKRRREIHAGESHHGSAS